MIIDAHMHMDSLATATYLKEQNIVCLCNVASSKEYEFIKNLQKFDPNLLISAGIHPWYIHDNSWEEMKEVLKNVNIIGEIGLDNVWCDTPIDLQIQFLKHQLEHALKYQKPVIIHVKGLEKELLKILHQYPLTYLIHWYSCDSYLQDFIDLDCYFTVGPSLINDRSVYEVAKKVPLNRILVETDGLAALKWCENREVQLHEYVDILKRSMRYISQLRHISDKELQIQMEDNLKRFIKNKI